MRLIVGLGNPGPGYSRTRHNLGFMVVEALAKRHGIEWREKAKFLGRLGSGLINGREVNLLLPMTFMNESGRSVRKFMETYKLLPAQVVVVCDDADLPLGKVRWRQGGSSGGHRGLQSILDSVASGDFGRLKMGIGRSEGDLADFVLAPFEPHEEQELNRMIEEGVRVLEDVVSHPASEQIRTSGEQS